MSDRVSLLTLPMQDVGDPETDAIGDPILDVLGSFLKASVNADLAAGWRVVCPRQPNVIETIQTHNPNKSAFTDADLPCLFLYRLGWPKLTPYSQDWKAQVTQIAALWVPDLEEFEKDAIRDPFKHAIATAIQRNIERGRNPAWKVQDDVDPKTDNYGSFLIKHLNVTKIEARDAKPFEFQVMKGEKSYPYDSLLVTIEVTSLIVATLDDYDAIRGIQGSLGPDTLGYQSFEFRPVVTSVTPSSGPLAGGTAITVSGTQFFEDDLLGPLSLTVDDVPCTSVAWVDESTITATTPAGSAGAKEVKVTLPNGASASLASAFTYA